MGDKSEEKKYLTWLMYTHCGKKDNKFKNYI